MIIIDSSSIAYRSYFALQKADLKAPDGRESGAVYGFLNTLVSLRKTFPSHDVVAVFDGKKPSFRRIFFEEYKANRERMPEPLAEQIESLIGGLPYFGYPVLRMEGFEADDIIASIVTAYDSFGDIFIVTRDKDLAQLVKKGVSLIYPGKSGNWDVMNEKAVFAKFGVVPSRIKDFLVLTGDASDNIPGVPGIGPKTAAKLLENGRDIDTIIENPKIYATEKIAKSIEQSRQTIEKAKILVELKTDLSIPVPEDLKNTPASPEAAEFLKEWGMKKIAGDFGLELKENPQFFPHDFSTEDIEGIAAVSCDDDRLFAFQKGVCQEVSPGDLERIAGNNILVSDDIKKSAVRAGFMPAVFEDAGTASYLINPENGPYDCVSLVKKHEGIFADFKTSLSSLPVVWKKLEKEMIGQRLYDLYREIEKPLIPIVTKMEKAGVFIDGAYLEKMSAIFSEDLKKIEEEIRKEANCDINPRSPKQLANLLFDKLKLPHVTKTKTGFSTDSYALEQIRALHPLVGMILEHRFISKMLSTYIDVIPGILDENSRLHCKFDLRATATGRFSSYDPNLQNIPMKNPRAREIRKAFRAPKGKKLLSADYSQIELRLAAHLSRDKTFLDAFRNGEDIHARTASEILSLDPEKIGTRERNLAKTVNFGVLYGMSPFKLSKDMGISLKEAKSFIDDYFSRFSRIKKWQEELVNEAEKTGEIRTFTGRRRMIDGLESRNMKEREKAKRKVFNTPVQGGAADIIKISMIGVTNALKEEDAELVLQIHDELLFEVNEKSVEKTAQIVKNAMENAVKLDVPLTVSAAWGDSWFETH